MNLLNRISQYQSKAFQFLLFYLLFHFLAFVLLEPSLVFTHHVACILYFKKQRVWGWVWSISVSPDQEETMKYFI